MRRSIAAVFAGLLALALSLAAGPGVRGQSAPFRRGDVNSDSRLDLSDAIAGLRFLFLGGVAPSCRDATDANDDGALDLSDPVAILVHLFLGGAPLAPPFDACGLDPTEDALGCDRFDPCGEAGALEFATPIEGVPGGDAATRDGGVFLGGPEGPAAPAPPEDPAAKTDDTSAPDRLIEESDLYKLEGTTLYVLNRYRGLQVIDLTDLDEPRLIGRAPIYGYPREMYVRGTRAFVVVSDYYTFWQDELTGLMPHAFRGSQLRVLDISDPTSPTVIGGIDLDGDCSDSRIVGDVMYLVSHRYPWYGGYRTEDVEDVTQVLSVSIADPADVRLVEVADFPRNGWEHHISVTQRAVYLAATGYDRARRSYVTSIRHIDIRDPAGAIAVRGEALVAGRVQDRWAMDEYEGVLRVASGASWGNGDVYLTTISFRDPDRPTELGHFTLHVAERLTAARFDGPRGYLVSYRNVDPLFTFDLSDPARPRLRGELEMSGWLDFIVPMGERLVALGHDDLVDPDTGRRQRNLAVSLIDVSGADTPRLLSRVGLDGVWGSIPSDRDDFAKVFRTLPSQGLILFPFRAWDPETYRHVGGVQLIDLDLGVDGLRERGLIEGGGWVERGIPYDDATVLTLSNEALQVVDIADRDRPLLRSHLELSRNVQDFALLGGEHTVQLAGDWSLGDTRLVVTSTEDPDTPEPLAQIRVPAPYGRLFMNGDLAYVVGVREAKEGPHAGESVTHVDVVDLSDPAAPRRRGTVALPTAVWPGYRSWTWGWGDEVVQLGGSTLVFHRYWYPWIRGCLDCPVVARAGAPGPWTPPDHTLHVVDLSDPDEPALASTITQKDVDWFWGLRAVGTTLYVSSYRSVVEKTRRMARYFLQRFDLSDPAGPVALAPVNVPGIFLDATADGGTLYTQETWWDRDLSRSRNRLHVLALEGDRAVLRSTVELGDQVSGILVRGAAAYASRQWWEAVETEAGVRQETHGELVTIDLADPDAAAIAGRVPVPLGWATLREVAEGRAFLGVGPGVFTYSVENLAAPEFETFHRTQGWPQSIVARGDRAYIPSGYYGVQVIDLEPQSPVEP